LRFKLRISQLFECLSVSCEYFELEYSYVPTGQLGYYRASNALKTVVLLWMFTLKVTSSRWLNVCFSWQHTSVWSSQKGLMFVMTPGQLSNIAPGHSQQIVCPNRSSERPNRLVGLVWLVHTCILVNLNVSLFLLDYYNRSNVFLDSLELKQRSMFVHPVMDTGTALNVHTSLVDSYEFTPFNVRPKGHLGRCATQLWMSLSSSEYSTSLLDSAKALNVRTSLMDLWLRLSILLDSLVFKCSSVPSG